MGQLSTFKANVDAAQAAIRDYAATLPAISNQTLEQIQMKSKLVSDVRTAQQIYAEMKRKLYIAPDGEYDVYYNGVKVGVCTIVGGESIIAYVPGQDTTKFAQCVIAPGSVGTIVSGVITDYGTVGNKKIFLIDQPA